MAESSFIAFRAGFIVVLFAQHFVLGPRVGRSKASFFRFAFVKPASVQGPRTPPRVAGARLTGLAKRTLWAFLTHGGAVFFVVFSANHFASRLE